MGCRLLPPLAAFLSLALVIAAASPGPSAHAQEAPAYLALGDSLAFGVGATNPSTTGYVALAHRAMSDSERFGPTGLELMNLGVAGARSADLLAPDGQLDSALSEILARQEDASPTANEVAVISVDVGGNDLLGLVAPGSPCLESASVEPCRAAFGEVLSSIDRNLTEIVTRLREAAPEATIVVVDLYNPYSGTGDLREPIAEVGVGQANGVIGAVTADPELRITTASIFALFIGRGTQWVAPDGIHPNDNGHRVIAEAVIAAIDNREPRIPEDLLALPPGATVAGVDPGTGTGPEDNGDGVSTAVLAGAVVVAFLAGGAVSGAYFVARGRA
jgi:lysophospholipase L1-like esterase